VGLVVLELLLVCGVLIHLVCGRSVCVVGWGKGEEARGGGGLGGGGSRARHTASSPERARERRTRASSEPVSRPCVRHAPGARGYRPPPPKDPPPEEPPPGKGTPAPPRLTAYVALRRLRSAACGRISQCFFDVPSPLRGRSILMRKAHSRSPGRCARRDEGIVGSHTESRWRKKDARGRAVAGSFLRHAFAAP